MLRIYGRGLTTTSGGNLSIRDEEGTVWISPGGTDKGSLRREDIVRVAPDGAIHGIHKPSVELPFHLAIYRARPDARAVLHAHSPALVAFSLTGTAPDTRVYPRARQVCGDVGFAPYAPPGSEGLGESIAREFSKGHTAVLLENHGVSTVGATLNEAFERFETLDFTARLLINAGRIGKPAYLDDHTLQTERREFRQGHVWTDYTPTSEEKDVRVAMAGLVRRAYAQSLVTSTSGTFAARCGDGRFVMTPHGMDRHYMEPGHLVAIRGNAIEPGKQVSKAWYIVRDMFDTHEHIHAVLFAHPPNAMAFAVTGKHYNTLTIPECFLLLRNIAVLPFGFQFANRADFVKTFASNTPVAFVSNESVVVTGGSLLEAFDRLEVCEYSAKSLIGAQSIGELKPIGKQQKRELEDTFLGDR